MEYVVDDFIAVLAVFKTIYSENALKISLNATCVKVAQLMFALHYFNVSAKQIWMHKLL